MKFNYTEVDWKKTGKKARLPAAIVGGCLLLLLGWSCTGGPSPHDARELVRDMQEEQSDLQQAKTFMDKEGFASVSATRRATGQTPMHAAVVAVNLPVMRGLLKLGADINVRNKKGETPLDTALLRGRHESIVAWLRDNGGRINKATEAEIRKADQRREQLYKEGREMLEREGR